MLNPDQFVFGASSTPNDPTRVSRSMYVGEAGRYMHISKEVAQGTIDTNVITPSHHVLTHCGKKWTSGSATDARPNNPSLKVCKSCSTKSGKE